MRSFTILDTRVAEWLSGCGENLCQPVLNLYAILVHQSLPPETASNLHLDLVPIAILGYVQPQSISPPVATLIWSRVPPTCPPVSNGQGELWRTKQGHRNQLSQTYNYGERWCFFLPCALWTSLNNSSMVSCSLNWICLNHRLDSRCFYIYIYMCVLYDISTWLVVEPPLWKIWLRQLGWLFPTEWKVIKFHGSKQPTSYTFFLILPNSRFLFTIASMHRTAQPVS